MANSVINNQKKVFCSWKRWTFAPCPTRRLRQNSPIPYLEGGQWCAFTHYPKRALDVITVSAWPAHDSQRCPKPEPFFLPFFPRSMPLMGQILGCFIKSNEPSFLSHIILYYLTWHMSRQLRILSFQYISKDPWDLYTLSKLNLPK